MPSCASTAQSTSQFTYKTFIEDATARVPVLDQPGVGDTINDNSDGTVREVRTADMSGTNFVDVDATSTRAPFRIDHSASIPSCETTGGAIRYNVAVSVYRNGIYLLSGWRHDDASSGRGTGPARPGGCSQPPCRRSSPRR